jgi:large subunit ribosomal protein L4
MASPKAPILDASGKKTKDATLSAEVFAAEVKPHLVHETVRAEQNARRAGTRGAKSRGLVSGGRAKPWRQKGTGRARAGTTRAPQWVGGGVAFPPGMRSFEVKVNKKAVKAAFRAALTSHAGAGTLAILEDDGFGEPSSRKAASLISDLEQPLLVVAQPEQETIVKSFRNLDRVLVTVPAELEVAELVWARSVLVTEAALPLVQARAG